MRSIQIIVVYIAGVVTPWIGDTWGFLACIGLGALVGAVVAWLD